MKRAADADADPLAAKINQPKSHNIIIVEKHNSWFPTTQIHVKYYNSNKSWTTSFLLAIATTLMYSKWEIDTIITMISAPLVEQYLGSLCLFVQMTLSCVKNERLHSQPYILSTWSVIQIKKTKK